MSGGKDSGGKMLGPQTPGLEEPNGATRSTAIFGSDVMAETLHALDIAYIALNPGASYRGLHDSIVNYLGNENPKMLLCLHEEHAVAIAQGWAKVTGKAMAVALHSNVGLMHGTMAIFNAWCDRAPMVILGATGNVDAAKRRLFDWPGLKAAVINVDDAQGAALAAEIAVIVRRIFADYVSGATPRMIAAALNREGVPAPRGRRGGVRALAGPSGLRLHC